MKGFPKVIDQTIYSSPAIADLDGDGWLDIVAGTGNFYAGRGYAVYAWDRAGNPLPGWPVATGGYVISVPSVGDIDGDGQPEVIVGCNDGKVYAFGSVKVPVKSSIPQIQWFDILGPGRIYPMWMYPRWPVSINYNLTYPGWFGKISYFGAYTDWYRSISSHWTYPSWNGRISYSLQYPWRLENLSSNWSYNSWLGVIDFM